MIDFNHCHSCINFQTLVEYGVHGMLGVHAQHHAVEDQRSAPETFLADSHAMVTQQTHKFVQVSNYYRGYLRHRISWR